MPHHPGWYPSTVRPSEVAARQSPQRWDDRSLVHNRIEHSIGFRDAPVFKYQLSASDGPRTRLTDVFR